MRSRVIPVGPRVLLVALLVWHPLAADDQVLPDPYASLNPSDNVVALAKLRPLLAKAPDDQHLLGLALMCYANLALNGEEENEGAYGPWLDYAGVLAERRAKARGGARPADFAAAEPELWVRLLLGYRQEVVEALAQWPLESQSARYRSLFVLASTDWRPFMTLKPRTVHEHYAAMRTAFEVGYYDLRHRVDVDEARLNPFAVTQTRWRARRFVSLSTKVQEAAMREAVVFTAWLLASSELDDATALPLLHTLGTALNEELDESLTRRDCWQRVMAAAKRFSEPEPVPIASAMAVCDHLLERDRGLLAPDGGLRLYGLGDLAAWNRDRFYMALFYSYHAARGGDDPQSLAKIDRDFMAVLRKQLPHSLTVGRFSVGYQGNSFVKNDQASDEQWDRFADLLAEEIAHSPRHAHSVIAISLSKLAIGRPQRAASLLRQVMAEFDGLPPRATLERLVLAAELTGEIPLLLPALRHWSQAAPMDHALHDALHKWSPNNTMLSLDGREPLRSWRDTVIDNRTLPWPGLELSQRFAIRWRGALQIPQAGSYVLATESDDDSRLAVGDVVVDNNDGDAQRRRSMRSRSMRAELSAGWLPLQLEFAQGSGEAGCRLLWQPPGASELVPIPAEYLAEREDGPAGLLADGFDQRRVPKGIGGPDADALAYARAMPWHLRVQKETGNELWERERYADALVCFRTILELDSDSHAGRRAAQCLLWSDPPDADAAIALMRQHPRLWANGWELAHTTVRLRKLGRLQEVVDAIDQRNRNDSLWPFVRGYAALDRGDLRLARDEFAKLMRENGPGDRLLPNSDFNYVRLTWSVLNRLDGKETDWAEVTRGIQRNGKLRPSQELVLDWLSSVVPWEECVARVPLVKDGEELLYYEGLVAMTTGDHATAQRRFQDIIDKHPAWIEAISCNALLKWYATQTPESLAKIATAKPIEKPAPQPDKPRTDANDF